MNIRLTTWDCGIGFRDQTKMLEAIGKGNHLKEREQKLIQQFTEEAEKRLRTDAEAEKKDRLETEPVKTELNRDDHAHIKTRAQYTIHDSFEESVAKRIADCSDVIFLQRTVDPGRAAFKVFEDQGFKIFYLKAFAFDTAIAIRTSMFRDVMNLSAKSTTQDQNLSCGQDIVAVSAIHNASEKRINFASVHSWNFKLYKPGTRDQAREYYTMNMAKANQYMQDAIQIVNQYKPDCTVVAGNMQSNPDNDSYPGPKTFEMMQKTGFQVLGPKGRTHISNDEEYRDQIVDFFFLRNVENLKKSLFRRIVDFVRSIFFSKETAFISPPIPKRSDLCVTDENFDFNENFSTNHLPVMTVLNLGSPSLIKRTCKAVRRLLCCKRLSRL